MKFAVCVAFEISGKMVPEFTDLLRQNARDSLLREPGCLQFDICTDSSDPCEFFLYEVYDSPEAFDNHLKSNHFKTFDAAVSSMIINKQVKTYRMVN